MNTAEALFAQYGKQFVELDVIAKDFLGITDPKTLSRMAHRNELGGIKAFKVRQSSQSPWLVDTQQLARVLDEKTK